MTTKSKSKSETQEIEAQDPREDYLPKPREKGEERFPVGTKFLVGSNAARIVGDKADTYKVLLLNSETVTVSTEIMSHQDILDWMAKSKVAAAKKADDPQVNELRKQLETLTKAHNQLQEKSVELINSNTDLVADKAALNAQVEVLAEVLNIQQVEYKILIGTSHGEINRQILEGWEVDTIQFVPEIYDEDGEGKPGALYTEIQICVVFRRTPVAKPTPPPTVKAEAETDAVAQAVEHLEKVEEKVPEEASEKVAAPQQETENAITPTGDSNDTTHPLMRIVKDGAAAEVEQFRRTMELRAMLPFVLTKQAQQQRGHRPLFQPMIVQA